MKRQRVFAARPSPPTSSAADDQSQQLQSQSHAHQHKYLRSSLLPTSFEQISTASQQASRSLVASIQRSKNAETSDEKIIWYVSEAVKLFNADRSNNGYRATRTTRSTSYQVPGTKVCISASTCLQFLKNQKSKNHVLASIDKQQIIMDICKFKGINVLSAADLDKTVPLDHEQNNSCCATENTLDESDSQQPCDADVLPSDEYACAAGVSVHDHDNQLTSSLGLSDHDFNAELVLDCPHAQELAATAAVAAGSAANVAAGDHESDPDIRSLISEIPTAPSSVEAFLSYMYLFRLQSKQSSSSFNEQLLAYKESMIFAYNSPSQVEHRAVSVDYAEYDVSHPLNPYNLPENETQLRRFFKLSSTFKMSGQSCKYVQCHYKYCGKLFSMEEYIDLQKRQLESKLIDSIKHVFCDSPNCPQTPLHYEYIEMRSNEKKGSKRFTVSHSTTSDQMLIYPQQPPRVPKQPMLKTYISSLYFWLCTKLKTSAFSPMLDCWKLRDNLPSYDGAQYTRDDLNFVKGEVWDGSRWQTDPDLCESKDENTPSPIMLTVNADGFNPHKSGNKSLYVVFITIDNLPISDRFRFENVLLYALIPGKNNNSCSKAQLETVLEMLVRDLKESSILLQRSHNRKVKLFKLVADQPAIRAIAGFAGVTAHHGCMYCALKVNCIYSSRCQLQDSNGQSQMNSFAAASDEDSELDPHSQSDSEADLESSDAEFNAFAHVSTSNSSSSSSQSKSLASRSGAINMNTSNQYYVDCIKFVETKLRNANVQSSSSTDVAQWDDILEVPAPHLDPSNQRTSDQVRKEMKSYWNIFHSSISARPAGPSPETSAAVSAESDTTMDVAFVGDRQERSASAVTCHDHRFYAPHDRRLLLEEIQRIELSHRKLEKEQKKAHTKTGIRWTPFIDLEYFDPVNSVCIDVMHNVFLGVVHRYFECLTHLGSGGLDESALQKIDAWVKNLKMPSDLGRMPSKWSGQLGHFKAIEWANLCIIFAIPSLVASGVDSLYILPLIPLQRLSFLLKQYTLTDDDINEIDMNIRLFYALAFHVCGPAFDSLNMHLMLHIPSQLHMYGPACHYWTFPYERFNGLVNQYSRSESEVLSSMMTSWWKHVEALYLFKSLQRKALRTEEELLAVALKYPRVLDTVNAHSDILSIPSMAHVPSAYWYQLKLNRAVYGEVDFEIESTKQDDQQLLQHRRITREGQTKGMRYRMSRARYLDVVSRRNKVEYLVSGYEELPCVPIDAESRLSYSCHVLSKPWCHATKAPVGIDHLTCELLNSFYRSRYQIPSDQLSAGFNSFVPCSTDNLETVTIQCYRQMNILGDTYSSAWSQDDKGYFCSLFLMESQGSSAESQMIPWFGQVLFFFTHEARVRSASGDQKLLHTFAFVDWLEMVNCKSSAELKLKDWISYVSSKDLKRKHPTVSNCKPNKQNSKAETSEKAKDLKQFMKERSRTCDKSIVDEIIVGRLTQDFPIVSKYMYKGDEEMSSRVVPVSRIFGRIALSSIHKNIQGAQKNNCVRQVVMHLPSTLHS